MDLQRWIDEGTLEYVKQAKLGAKPMMFPIERRGRFQYITVMVRQFGNVYAISAAGMLGECEITYTVTHAELEKAYEGFASWFSKTSEI